MTREPAGPVPDGVLVIDKVEGPTSHDVVQQARRALGLRRIGHTGTLDPMATGVLVLMLGGATRLAPQMAGHLKTYQGQGRLGWATDTYDRTGKPAGPERCEALPSGERLTREAASFTGKILQSPPAYSARKVDGVPLYKHARRGRKVEGKAVEVEIMSFTVEPENDDLFFFSAQVSAGTYIRSLIHDLGRQLGCGAHLESLRRVQAGPFTLDQAVPVSGLSADSLASPSFVPFHRIVLDLPTIQVGPEEEANLRQGRPARGREEPPGTSGSGGGNSTAPLDPTLVQVRDGQDHLVALATPDPAIPGLFRPRRVFPPAPDALTAAGPDASLCRIPREK
jgi:tRNA pseudouridine55 synthase